MVIPLSAFSVVCTCLTRDPGWNFAWLTKICSGRCRTWKRHVDVAVRKYHAHSLCKSSFANPIYKANTNSIHLVLHDWRVPLPKHSSNNQDFHPLLLPACLSEEGVPNCNLCCHRVQRRLPYCVCFDLGLPVQSVERRVSALGRRARLSVQQYRRSRMGGCHRQHDSWYYSDDVAAPGIIWLEPFYAKEDRSFVHVQPWYFVCQFSFEWWKEFLLI